MSVQSADYMYLGKKKCKLIDVEGKKQIIDCGDFPVPDESWYLNITTACMRGYTAVYYIVRKTLYGIKKQEVYNLQNIDEGKVIKSSKIMIPFTGSCIVAYGGKGWNSDFISSYLDYEEAFELYFEEGLLVEKLSLDSAIQKAKIMFESEKYRTGMEPHERAQWRERTARKPLKYKYFRSTYKWRKQNTT